MTGKVYLIGAGCGEADLITIKGFTKLLEANVVIYDSLVSSNLLEILPQTVEKLPAGKRFNEKSMPQEEINKLIIEKAKHGNIVARLKGGDPYVFGRGSEEALALEEASIEYEVIPGITSAVAVPSAAGIPVTHRKISRNVTIITGSSAPQKGKNEYTKEELTDIDYKALTSLGGTIIFLMGLHHLEEIVQKFIASGMDENMPCAVISKGCTQEQNTVKGNLKDILTKAKEANISTPSVIVIGECAGFKLQEMYHNPTASVQKKEKPLAGANIAVTGTESFFLKLSQMLTLKGATIKSFSFLKLISSETNLPDFRLYSSAVFTSPNGVKIFFEKLKKEKKDIRNIAHLQFFVIGTGTAEKLEEYGFFYDLMPEKFDSKSLGETIVKNTKFNEKILILRAKDGSEELTKELKKAGLDFTDFSLYELTEDKKKKEFVISQSVYSSDVDYLVFGSASGVKTFFNAINKDLFINTKIVCIGEKCANALMEYNTNKILIAENFSINGITERIEKDFKERQKCKD